MKTVFTNGVFDILHRGHIELLHFSKSQGDYLIVAIDSDERVKSRKGNDRPINTFLDRKFLLESIKYVDIVVGFNTIEDLRILHKNYEPDVVVKGSDWDEKYIRKMDGICDKSKIMLYPLVDKYSTTNTINKIKCI